MKAVIRKIIVKYFPADGTISRGEAIAVLTLTGLILAALVGMFIWVIS